MFQFIVVLKQSLNSVAFHGGLKKKDGCFRLHMTFGSRVEL